MGLLLDRGADMDARDMDDATALLIAATKGRGICAFHTEGAGGGHAPDILRVVGEDNFLPSSTNPTMPADPTEHTDPTDPPQRTRMVSRMLWCTARTMVLTSRPTRGVTCTPTPFLPPFKVRLVRVCTAQGQGKLKP